MAIIPKPPFPNVPNLPGVPQLARLPNIGPAPPFVVNLGLALASLWKSIFAKPQWAIYKSLPPVTRSADGVEELAAPAERIPVVVPDSFGEFSFRNESRVADYAVQEGGFSSYNKVADPFEISVRLLKGGTKEARSKFLQSIAAIVNTLDLYDIMTPEKTYVRVNVTRFELARRGAGGAYFFSEVDLYFREIRQATATYSTTSVLTQNSQNPSARGVDNIGSVQALPTNVRVS